MERGVTAQLCEMVASKAASHFGIATPRPAIVNLSEDFVRLVAESQQRRNPEAAPRKRRSGGLSFASEPLTGVIDWPVDMRIPDAPCSLSAGRSGGISEDK